jgi:hypothetical protein
MPLPIAPPLYFDGNLRVDIHCAEYFSTPDNGLRITLDDAPLDPVKTNGVITTVYDKHGAPSDIWSPTDVGYVAQPGVHRLRISAPGCADDDRMLEVAGEYAQFVTGRLAITDDSLRGPAGAPDGGGIMMGAFTVARPGHSAMQSDLWGGNTAVTTADSDAHGTAISISLERRHFVFATDMAIGWGSLTGTVQTVRDPQGLMAYPNPLPYTGTLGLASLAFRFGGRLALHDVALAAGSGIGGDVTISSRNVDETGKTNVYADAPNPVLDGDWFVPLWASLTIKPWCDWGFAATASYDVHPTALDESGVRISAGLLFQPSASCREAPGVKVTPP